MKWTLLVLVALAFTLSGCGKANIETSCTMNGWGSGECEFLNVGTAEGSTEIEVTVHNVKTGTIVGSTRLKSGLIKKGDVRSRSLLVSGVKGGCDADFSAGETWQDVCTFYVNPVKE